MLDFFLYIDRTLFLFFNSTIANPVFDVIFPIITNEEFWIIPAIVAAIFFIRFEKKKALLVIGAMLIAVAISDPVCCRILKPLFDRPRPCHPEVLLEGGRFLMGNKRSPSFPSAHAMNMFTQAMLLTMFYPRRWIWFFLFASLIGFSRIYVGVHYPLDVLAGALFGILTGFFVFSGLTIISNKIRRMQIASGKLKNPG
ncbi:MAG: phosphatase PAP2 family protein [Chitinivibrionales bacterium]|nr:phosphatase PAP2 family protein [Chitinivibrionales bacterium]